MASEDSRAEGSANGSSREASNGQQRTQDRRRELQQQCLRPSGLDHRDQTVSRIDDWLTLLAITEDDVRAHASTLRAKNILAAEQQDSSNRTDSGKQASSTSEVPLDADGWQIADGDILQASESPSQSDDQNQTQKKSPPADDGWKVVKHKKSKKRSDAETASYASASNSPDLSKSMQSKATIASGSSSLTSTLAMSSNPSAYTDTNAESKESEPAQTTIEHAPADQQQYPNLSSRDIEQVAKDVDRSFIGSAFKHLFSSPEHGLLNSDRISPPSSEDKLLRRKQLSHLILTTLSRYPSLSYFQGYHDIVAVILLTLSPHRPPSTSYLFPDETQQAQIELVLERLSLHLIRDSMTRDLLPIMGQLKVLGNLLRTSDPAFAALVDRASPLPFFALPWLLTLLTHDVTELAVMQRVLVCVLAYGPGVAIYLCAAVLLARKEEVEGMGEDELEDPAMLHTILGRLPVIVADEEGDGGDGKGDKGEGEAVRPDASPDSSAIYVDPDVDLPSLALDRQLAESGRAAVDGDPGTVKSGKPISTLLQEAVQLMERFPLTSDALQADTIMGPSSVLFTWPSIFASEETSDWPTLNAQASTFLTGPTDAIVRDPHPMPPTPPLSDTDEKDEKQPHRKRLNLREQTLQARMLAVVGLSGLLVAALFTASQQNPATTASQVVLGGTEETKRVLTLIVSLLSSWGRVVGSAQ